MKNDLTRLVLSVMTLVAGAALEELMPKFLGVGFPVLLALAILTALCSSLPVAIIYAVGAAAFEDSLGNLPYLTSAFFFLGAAAMARWSRLGLATMLVAYPCYQLWLDIWLPDAPGAVLLRFLFSVPVGIVTSLVAGLAFVLLERKAAIE